MINVPILNVDVKKSLHLRLINICSKVGRPKVNFKKNSEGQKKLGNVLLNQVKNATPLILAAVAAKTKNPQSAQVTNSILKALTCGKILSLTDMHGRGLRLKVMRNHFK